MNIKMSSRSRNTNPPIPDTLLDPKLNLYRLQSFYKSTEWYSESKSKSKSKLSLYRLKQDFLPGQLQQKWDELQLGADKKPTFKTIATKYLNPITRTKPTHIQIPLIRLESSSRPPNPKLTTFFYYDQDVLYFIKQLKDSLRNDPHYPFTFDGSGGSDKIYWRLNYRDGINETKLVYKNHNTHTLGYEYYLTVQISFQLGNTTLIIITDSSEYVGIGGKDDNLYLRLEQVSVTLRKTFLRALIPTDSVLYNYWLEYWKVVERRERWTYKLNDWISYYNKFYQISKKIPTDLANWLFVYFAENPVLPDYSESVEMIRSKFDESYRNYMASEPGLATIVPGFLHDNYRKEWCTVGKSEKPKCLVPTQTELCSRPTNPVRRFGYVPASQYSKYGNDTCLPYGKETYGYRSTPNLRQFPYYYKVSHPEYPLEDLNHRSISYKAIKQQLGLPITDWTHIRGTGDPVHGPFHPLELALGNRNIQFSFPESILQRLSVYVLDYETTGTVLGHSSDTQRRAQQLLKNQLVGDHRFPVNHPESRRCETISIANLRYFEANRHEEPSKYGDCQQHIVQFDGTIIKHNGDEVIRMVTTEPYPTLKTNKGIVTLHDNQIIQSVDGEFQSVLAQFNSRHNSVTWYSGGDRIVTKLVNNPDVASELTGWYLEHSIDGDNNSPYHYSIYSTGLNYSYNGERLISNKYPNINTIGKDQWMYNWFKSYIFYYRTFLFTYLIKPFREAREYYQQVPTQLGIIDVSPREQLRPPDEELVRSNLCGNLKTRDDMGNDYPSKTEKAITYQERHYYRTFTPTSWDGCPWMKLKYLDKHGDVRTVNNYQNCQAVGVSGLDDRALVGAEPFTSMDMEDLDRWLRKKDQFGGEEPIIVIMAHNGNTTDFPLLLKQYQQFQLALPPNIVWIDTLFLMSSLIPIVAPLFNYPEDFHRMEVDEVDYLITQLIRHKKTMKPGYHFPSELTDLLESSQEEIVNSGDESSTVDGEVDPNRPDDEDEPGDECRYKILKTSMGKRGLGEANSFCFFQDQTLKGEHNAYCDVIGLWSIMTDLFATVYQGVWPYQEGSYDYLSEREFIATRILLHELMRSDTD